MRALAKPLATVPAHGPMFLEARGMTGCERTMPWNNVLQPGGKGAGNNALTNP